MSTNKNYYMYSILHKGKQLTFVTKRTIVMFKFWFDSIHKTYTEYDDIKIIDKIEQRGYSYRQAELKSARILRNACRRIEPSRA